jgi:hypothetical protein
MKQFLAYLILTSFLVFGSATADRSQTEFFHAFLAPYVHKTCQDKGVFRQCFSITQADCEKSVRGMAKLCEKPLSRRMPQTLKTKRDAGFWGSQYAVCIARRFAEIHAEKMNKKNKDCRHLLRKKQLRKTAKPNKDSNKK